jgi:cell filamentation protein
MSRYSDLDAYLDPVSRVLRNRFGIADAVELERVEADLVAARTRELSNTPLTGKFDLAHLKAIHGFLFGDIYAWAGQLRTVDISKGENRFAHHAYLESAAVPIFERLSAEKCLSGFDAEEFCSRAAFYLGELNALHPFREGNGRTQREFVQLLARRNGYLLLWKKANRDELLRASIDSFRGDLTRLRGILLAIISR